MATKKSPKEAANIFEKVMKASVKGNPKPKGKPKQKNNPKQKNSKTNQ